jgi:hypothetical protein
MNYRVLIPPLFIGFIFCLAAVSVIQVMNISDRTRRMEFAAIYNRLSESQCQTTYFYRIKAYFGTQVSMSTTPARLSVEQARIDSSEVVADKSSFFYTEPDSVFFILNIDQTCQH